MKFASGRRAATKVQSNTLTATIATSQPLRLGRRATDLTLDGDLADVRIYPRALADVEVQALAFQPDTEKILFRDGSDAQLSRMVINDFLEIFDRCF